MIQIIKKDGRIQQFDVQSVTYSIAFAMLEVHNQTNFPPVPRDFSQLPDLLKLKAAELAATVFDKVQQHQSTSDSKLTVKAMHGMIAAVMLDAGMTEEAKAYARYQSAREYSRQLLLENSPTTVTRSDGETVPFNVKAIEAQLSNVMGGLSSINPDQVYMQASRHFREGIPTLEITQQLATSASQFISEDREYDLLAGRLSLDSYAHEAVKYLSDAGYMTAKTAEDAMANGGYPGPYRGFGLLRAGISAGVDQGLLNKELLDTSKFDFDVLERSLMPEGDALLTYQGVITLYKRYVAKSYSNKRYELPQTFFMRVAMGLSLKEANPTRSAIQIYRGYAMQRYLSSTPTLFNAGTTHSQLASCFLMEVGDDLRQIFGNYRDHALLSKFAGGIGTSWSKVRGRGSLIKGTNGESQGTVPWLKIDEEVTNSVNQGGKRKGACAAYMEPWHIDFPDFLQMKYTQGKAESFIEQMNTAAWIPDLFMKRVKTREPWTLFSPNTTPDLPDLYGKAFEKRYAAYEKKAEESDKWEAREFKFNNGMDVSMRVSTLGNPMHPCAQIPDTSELFKVHIAYLFSSGHPWITFKDAANVRSPQDHVGVVHSSNLCTEILLNTRPTTYVRPDRDTVAVRGEVAVCNLASVNLPNMLIRDKTGQATGIDLERLQESVSTLVRALDNVIDLTYYPIEETENSNLAHRPIGVGIMGWHHMLQELMIPYDSEEAVEMADHLQEHILFAALHTSVELAKERGPYSSFAGSKWSKGILPQDTPALLAKERGKNHCRFHTGGCRTKEEWDELRELIKTHGMRNSLLIAIAPTATIGKISGGTSQGVDPVRANVYIETDMEKDFTRINPVLVSNLKRRGIWTKDTARMLRDKIVTNYGSVQGIPEIPEAVQRVFKHALEISAFWTVRQNARRQKWIDQAISTNIYMPLNSDLYGDRKLGSVVKDLFTAAWEEGMKTTYYFKTESGSRRESTTVDMSREQIRDQISAGPAEAPMVCRLDDPTCEACQ